MRIYLSGPMTGISDHNRAAFDAAAKKLRGEGHFVINPHDLTPIFGTPEEVEKSFTQYYNIRWYMSEKTLSCKSHEYIMERAPLACAVMDADFAAVRSCDAIYLLKGWEKSEGAKRELEVALKHRLHVIVEGSEE